MPFSNLSGALISRNIAFVITLQLKVGHVLYSSNCLCIHCHVLRTTPFLSRCSRSRARAVWKCNQGTAGLFSYAFHPPPPPIRSPRQRGKAAIARSLPPKKPDVRLGVNSESAEKRRIHMASSKLRFYLSVLTRGLHSHHFRFICCPRVGSEETLPTCTLLWRLQRANGGMRRLARGTAWSTNRSRRSRCCAEAFVGILGRT